jgi:hypothetical protein
MSKKTLTVDRDFIIDGILANPHLPFTEADREILATKVPDERLIQFLMWRNPYGEGTVQAARALGAFVDPNYEPNGQPPDGYRLNRRES